MAEDERTGRDRALVVKTFRRVRSDPSTCVGDIHGPVKDFRLSLVAKQDQSLRAALKPPRGVHWKSATPVEWIMRLRPLLEPLLQRVPSALLTSRKTKEALRRLHDEEPLVPEGVDGKKPSPTQVEDVIDEMDDSLRMVLAHLREVKTSKISRERFHRKATEEQAKAINSLLDRINIMGRGPSESGGGSGGSDGHVATPRRCSAHDEEELLCGELDQDSPPDSDVNPADVFAAALKMKELEDDDPTTAAPSASTSSNHRFGARR